MPLATIQLDLMSVLVKMAFTEMEQCAKVRLLALKYQWISGCGINNFVTMNCLV